jgi:hypothetical protein
MAVVVGAETAVALAGAASALTADVRTRPLVARAPMARAAAPTRIFSIRDFIDSLLVQIPETESGG